MVGLYIHIPFCASRCIYCDFYSTTLPELHDRYVEALCREMDLVDHSEPVGTIYLGGGTPSQLSKANLDRLFSYIYKVYDVDPQAEVTIECNPDDIRPDMFAGLPINRVSMGAQTFSDERLRFLHRRHTAREVDEAMEMLRRQGIHNVSIDLMFGFPKETMEEWQADIAHILQLKPEHISAYGLIYEEGTPLYRLLERGDVKEVDEELSLDMYDKLIDSLTSAGYEHYEISNFARPGFRSRHNSSYWHDVPYIGLGASAHSYDRKTRSWNVANIHRYMESIERGVRPCEVEQIDDNTRYDDLVATALRTREGINLDEMEPSRRTFLLENAKPYIARHLLATDGHRLHLTREGIKISNTIMSDLMAV